MTLEQESQVNQLKVSSSDLRRIGDLGDSAVVTMSRVGILNLRPEAVNLGDTLEFAGYIRKCLTALEESPDTDDELDFSDAGIGRRLICLTHPDQLETRVTNSLVFLSGVEAAAQALIQGQQVDRDILENAIGFLKLQAAICRCASADAKNAALIIERS